MSDTSWRRRCAVALTAGGLAIASLASAPAAFAADSSEPGGAARHDGDRTADVREAIVDGPAKNVILIIGDGMGDSEITVARNYAEGAGGRFAGIDALPLTGSYTTYSLFPDGSVDYVPDSAATGTAWATGTKSYDGAISVDIHGDAHDSLLELAKANGLKTGNVSTAEIQDATPAVQAAHVDQRKCYGPDSVDKCGDDLLEKGGAGSISEQILDARADVTLGGGSASFEQVAKAGAWKGETLFEQASERGYQVVGTADELDAVTSADQTSPVLGTFAPGNFPTRFAPEVATLGGADGEPVSCRENADRLDARLSLSAMTQKSIDLLKGDDGFFLQVEGASIDKQDHAADACGQIGETIDLDEAVQVALDFAEEQGDTLVIVTADHAHTSQIVDSTPPTALSVALKTTEGSTMKVAYGTSDTPGSMQHTGAQVRIAAYGPGAANVVGLSDQTDNFFTIANALELDRDTAALSADAALKVPAEVAPGAELPIEVSGIAGDRQVSGAIAAKGGGAVSEIGRTDVIDAAAAPAATAPDEPGAYTVTVTGEQTGVELVGTFSVAEDASTDGGAATDADGADGAAADADGGAAGDGDGTEAGAGTGGGSGGLGGDLAVTGGTIGVGVLVAAVALIAAGALISRRRARQA